MNNFGNFNNMSPNFLANMQNQMNDFQKAFNENYVVIPKNDYKNKNNLIHNNVGEDVLVEDDTTYTIFADGYHRNHLSFKNPFKWQIKLGGMEDEPYVTLGSVLKNVKSIRIGNIQVPRYNRIKLDSTTDSFIYVTESAYDISSTIRFLVLKIDELCDSKIFSSGNFYKDNSFVLKADTTYAGNHLAYVPIHKSTINYRKGDYRNLSKLSISLYDDKENLLTSPNFEYFDSTCGDHGATVTRLFNIKDEIVAIEKQISENNYEDPYSDVNTYVNIIKRKSQLEELLKNYQMQVTIDVKIIENGLNTDTSFNY